MLILGQVQALRGEVERQQREQEDRMQQEKERLQEQLKGHIREHLRPLANQIVADVVQREVVGRVSQKVSVMSVFYRIVHTADVLLQLTERIPSSLRDEVNEYKLKILQAKARLHNSYVSSALLPVDPANLCWLLTATVRPAATMRSSALPASRNRFKLFCVHWTSPPHLMRRCPLLPPPRRRQCLQRPSGHRRAPLAATQRVSP